MVAPKTPTTPGTKDIDQLVKTLRNDPSLHVFLSDDFSPQAHVGNAVVAQRVEPALQDAQRASTILSASVRQHVIRRKEALLSEVEAVDTLEKEVISVSSGVSSLVKTTNELSNKLNQPYKPMKNSLNRITNISNCIQFVNAYQRFQICIQKLKDCHIFPNYINYSISNFSSYLPTIAQSLFEVDQLLLSTPSLDKIDGMTKDISIIKKINIDIRKRTTNLLKSALVERNQTDVEAAVIAFHSLGILQDRIHSEISRLTRETQTIIHRCLDNPTLLKKQTHPPTNPSTNPSSFHNDVWDAIDHMLSVIADSCFKAILLQHVLSRKYCPNTHYSLLHDTIASSFIDTISKLISEQISILIRTRNQKSNSAQIFLILAEGYPRLRALLKDLATRINTLAHISPIPILKPNVINHNHNKLPIIPSYEFIEKSFLTCVIEVETHYFTASLQRLTKTVNSLFDNGHKQPGETEALNLTKILAAELSSSSNDRQLKQIAINNIATAIRLYTSQAEDYAALSTPDNNNFNKMPNQNQQHSNIQSNLNGSHDDSDIGLSEWHLSTMYNGMVTLATAAGRVLGDGDDGSGEIPKVIEKELNTLSKLSDLLLDGPFSQCQSNILKSLQRIHTEDLESMNSNRSNRNNNNYYNNSNNNDTDEDCSVYVLDISTQISMFSNNVIPILARSRCLGKYTLQLAKWILETFIYHVSLVFPQSKSPIKMRLSTDMAKIELAIESLCPARLLGKTYRSLRALRACILISTDDFIDVDASVLSHVKDLPMSILANVILGRCNDPLLIHPHRRLDQTPAQYVEWLQKHSELQAWKEIEESLKLYTMRKDPNKPNLVEYDAITSLAAKLQN